MTDHEPGRTGPVEDPARTGRRAGAVLAALLLAGAAAGLYRGGHPVPGDGAEPDEPAGIVVEPDAPERETASAVAPETEPQVDADVTADAEPVAPEDGMADAEVDAAEVESTAADEGGDPQAPAFDLVRVERDGSAVIAGTAAPGARVTIRSDAEAVAETKADADGNFVAIFRADPGTAPQALTLDAESPDGTQSRSDDVVMLLPAAPADGESAVAGPETEVETEAQAEVAAPTIAATAVVRADGAVEVTPTEAPAPDAGGARQVTLSTIAYSEAGEVTLSGLGTPAAGLRAYVDGQLAGESIVAEDGRWALELDDLAEGLYRLRIDALDATGRVASRVETPFQRDFPAAPLPRPGVEGAVAEVIDGAVTVQPGNTLWTLARVHYGSGVLFTQIFTANSALIRDPDLIYPGQVLALPGAEEAD